MIPLKAADIARIVGGELVHCDPQAKVTRPAEFDSRKAGPGSLFLALPGARVDGHDFIAKAISSGATLALAARDVGEPAVVLTPLGKQESNADAFAHDPRGEGAAVLRALGTLARFVVDTLAPGGLDVIGVTGSAGKTSTKDMLATILRAEGPTVAPEGSFNNEIGHPYTVLQADHDTKYLVAEMSARGVGHVAHLAEIAPPKVGAVLNVGTAHLGEFGSREVIAQAKGELVEALPSAAAGGVAVLNADDDLVAAMATRTSAKVVYFSAAGAAQADYRATDITLDDVARASFTLHTPSGQFPVALAVHGAHQVANALAAIAVAVELGVDTADVVAAISSHVAASRRRMEVQELPSGLVIINDSYNANPDSMRAGIDAMLRTATARSSAAWAVLGQMGELGAATEQEHHKLAEYLQESGVNNLVAVGESDGVRALADKALELGLNTFKASDTRAAAEYVAAQVGSRDVVLVKASYADQLWQVADLLTVAQETVDDESEVDG